MSKNLLNTIVMYFCDGRIVPINDGFSAHLAGRLRVHAAIGTTVSVVLADRGWNDPLMLRRLSVPVDLVSPEHYYSGGPEIEAIVNARCPDVIVIPNSHVLLAAATSRIAQFKIVYEVHELASDLASQLGERHRTYPERVLESAAAKCADLVVAFTDRDRAKLVNAGLDPQRVMVRPCIPSMADAAGLASSDPKRMVFLGNGYYEPNRRAIEFLAQKLVPLLPRDALLSIIGTQPLWPTLRADSRVSLLGPVENLIRALQSNAVGLCPVWHATGIRMKVLDYGAAGLVTVAARCGLEGIPSTTGVIGVDGEEEFIEAVLRLINNPEECAFRQSAAIERFRNGADTVPEAELLSRALHQPTIGAMARHRIVSSKEVQEALVRCPQPRWLEETLQTQRFSRGCT